MSVVITATGTEMKGRALMLKNRVRERGRGRSGRENNPHYLGLPSLNPCCCEWNWSHAWLCTYKHHMSIRGPNNHHSESINPTKKMIYGLYCNHYQMSCWTPSLSNIHTHTLQFPVPHRKYERCIIAYH